MSVVAGKVADIERVREVTPMSVRVDCNECLMRNVACGDCVVTLLLGPPDDLVIDAEEARALTALADGGLVPPLRLVTPVPKVIVDSA